jgi:hypothetical protein
LEYNRGATCGRLRGHDHSTRSVQVLIFVLTWLLANFALPTSRSDAATFHGQVVDASTGEPLEGAVIAVIWHRYPYVYLMDPVSVFQKAVETTSDADGKFAVDAAYGWFPFTFKTRRTVVFKPGYRPILDSVSDSEGDKPLFKEQVLRLEKLRTGNHLKEFTTYGDFDISHCGPSYSSYCVPENRIKHLTRLLQLQRKILGLEQEGKWIR